MFSYSTVAALAAALKNDRKIDADLFSRLS